MRTVSAVSAPTSFASVARMSAWTSCAWSGVAVRPVPIAQTGSYAMTSFAQSAAVTSLRPTFIWRTMTSSSLPASRSSSVSPTQTMAVRPAAIAALARRLTVSSVSPKYWRRSLWPMMTYFAPASSSIPVEISPVYAPDSFQWQFSAPMPTWVPAAAATAAGTSIAGVQHTTSTFVKSFVASTTPFTSAAVSDGLMFIFQLPAMIFFLIVSVTPVLETLNL